MKEEQFMKKAIHLAEESVWTKNGGPFGAIVVKNGEVIGIGKNSVTTTNDPTAHAEVMAIRDACAKLGTFQLTDCVLYTSCEPCPMCLGAIYWARPMAVYYAATKKEAAAIAFDDQFIYDEIALPYEKRTIPMQKLTPDGYHRPFELWVETQEKTVY